MAKLVIAHATSDTEMVRSRFAKQLPDCSWESRPGKKDPEKVTVSTFTNRYEATPSIRQLIFALEQAKKIKVQSAHFGQGAEPK